MAVKVFKNPFVNQTSPLFTLDDNLFYYEILLRIDYLSIQCFRATCQEASLKVGRVGSHSNFWNRLLVTYFPDYVKNTWRTINDIANPRDSFFHVCDTHDFFVKALIGTPINGFDVSETLKRNPWLLNTQKWKSDDDTPLIEFVRMSKSSSFSPIILSGTLSEMLENGADITKPNVFGKTPLHIAAKMNLAQIGKLLIEKGAPLEATLFADNQTPLFIAVINDSYEMVELLIDKSANVNAQLKDGTTLLHIAAKKNRHKIGELLIDNGALLEAPPLADNYTPLFIAVINGSYEMVELLIGRDANVNAQLKAGTTLLHIAAKKNRHKIGELLINKGALLEAIPPVDNYTPLFMAVIDDSYEMTELLICKGANVNAQLKDGHTLLHIAAKMNRHKIGELLINKGALLEATSPADNYTPLFIAVINDSYEMAELLICEGANVNTQLKDEHTLLHIAAKMNRHKIGELLINKGALLEATSPADNYTPLFIAVINDSYEMAELLICEGANVNTQLKDGTTLLHIAAKKNHHKIGELLINKGALLEATPFHDNQTPLFTAVINGFYEMVELLIGSGANVNAQLKDGRTPLHIAAEKNHHEIGELLINKGALLEATPFYDNQTPLSAAVINGSYEMVELLIGRGANVNAQLKDGHTPLHIAAEENHHKIGELLIDNGALLEATPLADNYTPLLSAVLGGSYEMVELLIGRGANVNVQLKDGTTLLHIAAKKNHHKIGELLIKNGAKVDVQTTKGNTPLEIAKENGASEMVKLLEPLTQTEELPLKKWKGE